MYLIVSSMVEEKARKGRYLLTDVFFQDREKAYFHFTFIAEDLHHGVLFY